MSRRTSLPGAAELFRATASDQPEPPEPAPAAHPGVGAFAAPPPVGAAAAIVGARAARRIRSVGVRSPSGRERHAEKITVYCAPDELLALESARLALRAEHDVSIDRGRIVREAIAVVLADLEAKGEDSILVRRLRQL
jgi:hypothetical protein